MNISERFIKRPVMTTLVMLAILIFGLTAYSKLPVSDHVVDYAVSLARATRPREQGTPAFINEWLTCGAGPRAAQYLVLGAKAHAVLRGRLNVSCDDVRAVAKPVLRHRIILNFAAQAERISTDDIVEQLVGHVGEK